MSSSPTPSQVAAVRLTAFRNAHNWTQAELADRMKTHGWSWDRTTIAKLEAGSRQLSVDELVSLAWVLGVSPTHLITPTATSEAVSVTPFKSVETVGVWRWLCGVAPLDSSRRHDETISVDEAFARDRFYYEACPEFVSSAERELPGINRLLQLLMAVQGGAGRNDDPRWRDGEQYLFEEATELLRSLRRRSQLQAKRKAST